MLLYLLQNFFWVYFLHRSDDDNDDDYDVEEEDGLGIRFDFVKLIPFI